MLSERKGFGREDLDLNYRCHFSFLKNFCVNKDVMRGGGNVGIVSVLKESLLANILNRQTEWHGQTPFVRVGLVQRCL